MSERYRVVSDLYDIADRLKEIDERYELYFNRAFKRFEVFANGALQIAAPFDRLDGRLLELVRSTRLEYAERLLKDIDESNRRLESEATRRSAERIVSEVEKAL